LSDGLYKTVVPIFLLSIVRCCGIYPKRTLLLLCMVGFVNCYVLWHLIAIGAFFAKRLAYLVSRGGVVWLSAWD
jgi:hypothetical protein